MFSVGLQKRGIKKIFKGGSKDNGIKEKFKNV